MVMNNLIKNNFFFENFLKKNNIIKDIYKGNSILIKILKIKGKYLLVDGNLKSLSYIKKDEFLSENININYILGKFFKVLIINLDNSYGSPIFSREKYFSRIFWKYIYSSLKKKLNIAGVLLCKIKGGFSIMMSKFKCFLPFSEVDKRILLNYNFYKNKKLFFNVINFNYKKKNIILSRKNLYYNYTYWGRVKIINNLKRGNIIKGIVKGFSGYGIYIDLGYLDGLVLLKNMSWGPRKYANEILEINKSISAKVLNIDKINNRIYLGIKQIYKNPWKNIFTKYKIGYLKYGRVFKITNDNIYIILELGVYGYIKKIKTIKNLNDKIYISKIKINDYLKLIINYINVKKRFIGFKLYRNNFKKKIKSFELKKNIILENKKIYLNKIKKIIKIKNRL